MTAPHPAHTSRYADPAFLRQHINDILAFYYPRCINHTLGGYYQFFKDDGRIYDERTQHLVSTCRFIFIFSLAYVLFGVEHWREAAAHGVAFLRHKHRQANGGYAWQLKDGAIEDPTYHAYGHAFVLLAYAWGCRAGLPGCREWLDETFELMERHFFEPEHQLYADQISADWQCVEPYRGQNANMHTCEAMLAAWEASGDSRYLHRASTLARRVTCEINQSAAGLVWEHFRADWSVDWDYNREQPDDLFRPPGFIFGHWAEWTKLLLILEQYQPAAWIVPQATLLFDEALKRGWDDHNGGLFYTAWTDGTLLDRQKYHWVHTESIAAAALLAKRSGDASYWQWYDRLWQWSERHLIDHQYGAWFRILSPENGKITDEKSPAGKTDYHPIGMCWDILRVLP